MRHILAATLVAAMASVAPADDPTYTLTIDVGGTWGSSWIKTVEGTVGRLDGVKSAKVANKNWIFTVKVLEDKALMPSKIAKALEAHKDTLAGVTIELAGTVEKAGDGFVLVARASGQKYALKIGDVEGAKLVADRAKLVVTGALSEPEEKDGRKPLPLIELSSAKEDKDKK